MATDTSEPEVYPRADGTVYLCGAGGEDEDAVLPERADQVLPAPEAIQRLKDAAAFVSPGTFDKAEVVAEQCCFRPNSHTGLPVIGKIREGSVYTIATAGASPLTSICRRIWMASGHGVWGIRNGPGTGKCLVGRAHAIRTAYTHQARLSQAELILGLPTSADISRLSP